MSQLPRGWNNLKIKDINLYKSSTVNPSKFSDETFELFSVPIFPTRKAEILKGGEIGSTKQLVQEGDVLLCKINPRINRVWTVTANKGYRQIASSEWIVIRSNIHVSNFLKYFFREGKFRDLLCLDVSGVGGSLTRAKPKLVADYEVIVAPLAEQSRIVEKFDEVLAQVDTIKARLDGIPAILKRFRQSILASAVSGKLTEEWRGVNTSTNIANSIQEILSDRSKLVSKRTKEPQTHLKDDEYEIPNSWKWVSLDSLSSKIVDGVHHKPEYIDEGVPFMSVKDINHGKMSFDNCKYISADTHEQIHLRCNPEKGDLLITKSGTIGRTAIVNTDMIFDLFVSVALIKPASAQTNMEYINIALCQWVNTIDVSSRIVGTAIKNLHLRDMRVLAIPFAPIEEQKEIVRLVDQYFAFADTIETQVKKAQSRVDNLTQSILAKAFRGELVPQDPNDESADKLLKRIAQVRKDADALAKAAKKAATAKKKAAKK